jgi:hypothetical protein
VVSLSGLGGAFVEVSALAVNANPVTASAMAMSIFNVFIVNVGITTSIIHQPSKKPSKKFLRDFPSAGVSQIQPIGGAMKRRQQLKNTI